MKVYITYFRYDRDENYSIYHIDFNKRSSIKHYKEEDLPSFLGYGPDDVSILTLQEVDLTKTQLTELIRLYGRGKDYDQELIDFMIPIFDNNYGDSCIFSDSGDTVWEVLEFFRTSGHYDLDSLLGEDTSDYDEDCLEEMCQDKLFDDDKLFEQVLKDYIKLYY